MHKITETLSNHKAAAATSMGLALVATQGDALAATGTPSYNLDAATGGIVDQVQAVLTNVLPIAGGLIALTVGWKFIKRMTKSA